MTDSFFNVCRRYPAGGTNTLSWDRGSNLLPASGSAGCFAGADGQVEAVTHQEAELRCAAASLELCKITCKGRGCAINTAAVWTSIACTPTG